MLKNGAVVAILCCVSCLLFSCQSLTGRKLTPEEIEAARDEAFQAYRWKAGYLDHDEPAPAWMTPFHAPTIEFMYTLPGGRILVGLGRQQETTQNLLHGDIVMYRLEDGTEQWRHAREESMKAEYAFLTYVPSLIFLRTDEEGTTFIALDPDTGIERWSVDAPAGATFALSIEENLLITASEGSDATGLRAYDMQTGQIRWEGTSGVRGEPRLRILHGDLWVIGKGISVHDIASGESRWETMDIDPVANRSYALETEGGVLLGAADSYFYRIDRNGRIAWKTRLPQEPGVFSFSDDEVYVSHEDIPGA
jgi:outer membrane protein assembly factor BamB